MLLQKLSVIIIVVLYTIHCPYLPHVCRVATVDELTQQYVLMPASVKDAYLIHLVDKYLDDHPKGLIIIFVQTCKLVPCQLYYYVQSKD